MAATTSSNAYSKVKAPQFGSQGLASFGNGLITHKNLEQRVLGSKTNLLGPS